MWKPIEELEDNSPTVLGWDGVTIWPCAKVNGRVIAIGQKVIGIMYGNNVTHFMPMPREPRC